jgi:hypothetical protein
MDERRSVVVRVEVQGQAVTEKDGTVVQGSGDGIPVPCRRVEGAQRQGRGLVAEASWPPESGSAAAPGGGNGQPFTGATSM